jgi:mRNA-degrading endonuclease RelE of RelBE toxin-antitoxin system
MGAFTIHFLPRARDQLKAFRKRDQQIITDAVNVQLSDNPDQPTRKRKHLEENLLAAWELRVGDFRVFYDVDIENCLVMVVAIGKKSHNVLWIDDEEVQL